MNLCGFGRRRSGPSIACHFWRIKFRQTEKSKSSCVCLRNPCVRSEFVLLVGGVGDVIPQTVKTKSLFVVRNLANIARFSCLAYFCNCSQEIKKMWFFGPSYSWWVTIHQHLYLRYCPLDPGDKDSSSWGLCVRRCRSTWLSYITTCGGQSFGHKLLICCNVYSVTKL